MGAKESSEKPRYDQLFFGQCNGKLVLRDEISTNIDQKIAMNALFRANYHLNDSLDRTIAKYTNPIVHPGGPDNHIITRDILEYKTKQKELCKLLIEECINSYITNGETRLLSVYKQHTEILKRLKRTYNTRVNYYWNGNNYARRTSFCSYINGVLGTAYTYKYVYSIPSKIISLKAKTRHRNHSLMYAYDRE